MLETNMKTNVAVVVGLMLVVTGALAHHSAATEFDPNDTVAVEGVIVDVEWKNPHIWFYVDVKDANGEVTTWGFTGSPPGMLTRRGITRDVLKVGAEVKVDGFRARDGSPNATARNVTFADGRSVFAGTPGDPAGAGAEVR
jgi:hypothetical protein